MAEAYAAYLSAADASAVVEQLDASGVAYQLADGGATVMVPKDSVYQMRLKTAAAGLPAATRSSVGSSP